MANLKLNLAKYLKLLTAGILLVIVAVIAINFIKYPLFTVPYLKMQNQILPYF